MTTVFDAIVAGVMIVGGIVLLPWCYSKVTKKYDRSAYSRGREFATKFCQEKGSSQSSLEELQNFVDGAKTFGDFTSFDKGVEDIVSGLNVTKIAPRNITPRNVLGILEIFGLTGHIVVKGQGWARCYVQYVPQAWPLDPNPIPLQFGRIMFEHGKFSHFNFYLDPQGRIHETMYYEIALQVFRLTGLVLDAPAWSDLVARATQRADDECAQKQVARGLLPKRNRRKLAAPNYAHCLVKELEKDLSELFSQNLHLSL